MEKICSVNDCTKKVYAKGYCNTHYLRMRRYGRLTRYRSKWIDIIGGDSRSKEYRKRYRELNGIKSIGAMHKVRFGGMREFVILRDGEKCQMCGMTREEHKKEWNRDITVDHIDNQGRYSETQNNNPDNLWTLCLRCHGSKDGKLNGVRKGNIIQNGRQ